MAVGIIFIVGLINLSSFHVVNSRLSQTEATRLNNFMSEVMRCARLPAASVALVSNGEVAYTNGYGTANQPDGLQAGRETAFCLGSGTQTFTATLLAKLLSNNKNYTWDTPISKILGSWVMFYDNHRTKNLNLKDILAMRTGFSNMDMVPLSRAMGRYRLISNLKYAPEIAKFREKYLQSDIMFVLVEEVIRELGSDTWEKLLKRHILDPIGITRPMFLNVEERQTNNFAGPVLSYNGNPYAIPFTSLKGFDVISAGSALCLSADDMAKWLLFNLELGKNTDKRQVLGTAALEQLFEPWMFRTEDAGPRSRGFEQPNIQVSYSRDSNTLGWIKGHYRGYPTYTQGGNLPGYESLYSIIPGRAVGVHAAFVGDNSHKAYAAISLINIFGLDMLLHGAPWFDTNNVCKIMEDMTAHLSKLEAKKSSNPVHKAPDAQRELDAYAGDFRHLAFGDIKVVKNESEYLHLKYGSVADYIMRPTYTPDVFILEATPGPLWYSTHTDFYQQKGPYLAYFNVSEADDVIDSVRIPHFDRYMHPVFSRRVKIPEPEPDEVICDSGSSINTVSVLSVTFILILIVS
ncbi:uncharacterized protein LOC126816549 [Patella vulgata]|uniref:uncharacterized protein LOC126816549 n=1 Tax=Patella vulgata TaxID=6465 RepID=UPI00217F647C|nr:uncharacterized protein LOC126816549 [Patella vulgata]